MTEAAFIGFTGGVFGVLLSLIISRIVNMVGFQSGQTYNLSVMPLCLIGLAIVFATFIGILAGYFPARRAMKLSALLAIKAE